MSSITSPAPGCIVEYLESNAPQIAYVLENTGGKLRLLLPSRRETKMNAARVLPWIGPAYSGEPGREEIVRILETHRARRSALENEIELMNLWEMAQGEIDQAPAQWFAELDITNPDADVIAAYGHALLACKTHFHFQPPEFEVYNAQSVEKRLAEQKIREEKEALAGSGADFLRMLWDKACQKKGGLSSDELQNAVPGPISERIYRMLYARMLNPDSQEDESLWNLISKSLPDVPHLPFQLLTAWGKLPLHHNFWLDRAGYDRGDDWQQPYKDVIDKLASEASSGTNLPAECALPFLSIDNASTRDIDDAFYLEKTGTGWKLAVALACPAYGWPFGSDFDKLILSRGTSIYLPEENLHMLPESLGTNAFSLLAGEKRLALLFSLELDQDAKIVSFAPSLAVITLAANLRYDDVEAAINNPDLDNPATQFRSELQAASDLGALLEQNRVNRGAVIMQRPETILNLVEDEACPDLVRVELRPETPAPQAHRLVSEMMILTSSAFADWAHEHSVPLIHRTQNTTIPREFAGIWTDPADMARVMRALAPSILETAPKPHAAIAAERYAPITSPLRRYTDLVNEAQLMEFLNNGAPRWSETELDQLLERLAPALEGAGQTQRFRPRYWKLLYFRQQGDKAWWNGVITDENEAYVTVSLPEENILVRGRRQLFDERAAPGQRTRLRLGKINPLYNEIQILETAPAE